MRRWMQDSVREVLAYLKTARELEIGLMKLDKLEKHSNWKILQLEGKAYPEFQPPNARIEQERADAKSKARAIGAVFGGIAGFVFEFVEEWRIVEASGSPLAWFGNLVVFGMAAATCAAIGAGRAFPPLCGPPDATRPHNVMLVIMAITFCEPRS